MNVIGQQGADWRNWSTTGECPRCMTKFHIYLADVHVASFKYVGHFFDDSAKCRDRYYAICPLCQPFTYIFTDPARLPALAKDEIRRERNDDKT